MKISAGRIAATGITASVYTVLTLLLPIPAYGEIQCRLSEVMNLLAFVNPAFAPGIVLGCFVSNMFSSVNPVLDCVFGTLATALTMLCVTKCSRSLFVASLWPTVFCVFVGGMILFESGLPWTPVNFLAPTAAVMVGEFVAMTVIGYPLFRQLLKNERFAAALKRV